MNHGLCKVSRFILDKINTRMAYVLALVHDRQLVNLNYFFNDFFLAIL